MAMEAESILAAQQAQYKSTEVEKEVELQFDVGNLLATDLNNLNEDELKKNRDEYLHTIMRDNTQLLLNKIWELPVEKTDEGLILAQLPSPTTVLPREKRIPKPRPPTTWELFAKQKGIRKEKRSRMVFDEQAQEWKPRWGYNRVGDTKQNWMMEVPDNADPNEDQFEKHSKERAEKIAKNEYQRLSNISKAEKGKRLKVPLPPPFTKNLGKHELTRALGTAKSSTASVGKFTPSLPKEPEQKREKKRRFAPVVGDAGAEKQRSLDLLSKLSKKREVLDVKKATTDHLASEQTQTHRKRKSEGREGKKPTKRSKMGGVKKSSRGFNTNAKKGAGKTATSKTGRKSK
ncbi:ribosome biogenesis regulatory protein homolog [Halichondria panicea]|uniref:ribosome biogenesis regulatory protein homolog n=1 Tax=Halichondria panicea TaxID=6063 RepID=UPI00312B990B